MSLGSLYKTGCPPAPPGSVSAEPLSPGRPRALRLRGYSSPGQDFAFPRGSVGRSLPAPPPAWRVPAPGSVTLWSILRSSASSAALLGARAALAPRAPLKGFSSLTPGTDPGHTASAGAPAGLCAALTAWRVSQRSGHLPVPWHRLSFVCLPARVGWETVSKAVSHRPRLSLSLGAGCYIVEGCRGGYAQFLLRKPADRSQTPPVLPGSPGLFSPSPSQGSR